MKLDKETIKNWLKTKENWWIIGLMIFTIVIRFYYFFKLGNQPIWWDEGDYLAISKVWALGMPQPEWWAHFTGMRPMLIPIIWMLFMKLGLGEFSMRFFTLLIPSILTVYLVYAVARDLYNKKVGLIAGAIMSVYWVHLFYSFRLLTDIPSLFLGMLTIYFFWSRYVTKGDKKGLYWAAFFGVLAFAARFPHGSILFVCFLFLFLIERKQFFKNKTNWKALGLTALFLLPYMIYFLYNNFYVLRFYFGPAATNLQTPLVTAMQNIFAIFPSLFGPTLAGANLPIYENFLFLFLFIGIFSLYGMFICFDIFWKQKDKRFNADFFVLLLALSQIIIYVFVIKAANDRWLFMLMPPLFFLAAKGAYVSYNFLKKYSNYIAIFLIGVLLILGLYFQLSHANYLIDVKKDTYKEVKLGGEWLKENTHADAKIITASIVQNQYYSERQSYDFNYNNSNNLSAFEEKLRVIKPDYIIVNVFE
ncbi:MAG: glycosyltransferase family 39 protein, partial [archaeon]|nr:glycosyltransferase family 39 protein [archaeon]